MAIIISENLFLKLDFISFGDAKKTKHQQKKLSSEEEKKCEVKSTISHWFVHKA